MEHPHIVQASDLSRYADTRDSQAVIPELVNRLVRQSVPNAVPCRIPYGDDINQPGPDGIVECEDGYSSFVPRGKSVWEIGTGANPQKKATEDFEKRTKEFNDVERENATFVFVTPRSWKSGGWSEPKQKEWLNERKDKGWKNIQIIDGGNLADWLREFPALGHWMTVKLNWTADLGGLSTTTEHWEKLVLECATGDLPFPPKLFTIGRESACDALHALFEGKTQSLNLFAENQQDVADFVSAFLAELDPNISQIYNNQCLYINDEQAWRSIVACRDSYILVADPRLGLETEEGAELQIIARRKGHSVIVPRFNAWSGNGPEILELRSPSQWQIKSAFKESGYTDIRAEELGQIGGGRISALRRHLQGYGILPPYATWDNASLIAKAGLVGKWDGTNPADRSALEMLLGKDYGEWIENLKHDTLRSDSPLIQHDEKWRFVGRGEAWGALGNLVTDEDLDRLKKTAISVLSEHNQKFDLPKEERFMANIHGKVLTHSDLIRKGIAETLALIGSRPKALVSCSLGKVGLTAVLVVRSLLNKADWQRWASLDSIMPLLAEAAPEEFLDAVESVLVDLDSTPFHKIFAEEGGGVIGGSNYMCGLLWALETLAWSPEYLSRVSMVLADIASIDPGGNWTNRPLNSLVTIFLPWHVQTTAPFEKRKSAITAILNGQPEVGWNLLLALLPHSHKFMSDYHLPVWRDFIPQDWKDGTLRSEYREQITAYTDLAVHLAKKDVAKLCELIKRLSNLSGTAHESLLNHLTTDEVVSLPEAERLPIWESLDALVRDHRKFSDANWALPEDAVNKIAETAQALEPTLPEFKYRYFFSGKDFDLLDENKDYKEQQKHLAKARQAAVSEILGNNNVDAVLKFATKVAVPRDVGLALGSIISDELEVEIIPSRLDAEDDTLDQVVAGFIWARFWKLKTDWIDAVLEREWTPEHKAKFLTLLPFEQEVWERVSSHLGESHEKLYWKNVRVNPYSYRIPDDDSTIAIEKLLEYGREEAAVMCVACTRNDESQFNESLATRALLAVIKSGHRIKELDNHQTVELIKHLQKSETADQDALFQIEWNFLPWLDQFSAGSAVTLEKRLASDPDFFAEIVRLAFRSENASKDDNKEPDEQKKDRAENVYMLLSEWHRCPGIQDDESFSVEVFNAWINKALRITKKSGHTEIAQDYIGQILTYAPQDPDGLWIHNAVAKILNLRDTKKMRMGFITELCNQHEVYLSTRGKEERKLASENQKKAEALESKGYVQFAAAMRDLAKQYARDAEHEEKRNPFED